MVQVEESPPKRLNPFAFPSDTTFRFGLLIVVAISTSVFAADWFHTILFGEEMVANYGRCFAEGDARFPTTLDPQDSLARQEVVNACLADFDHQRGLFLLGGAALVVAGAVAIYLAIPSVKMRRRGLVKMDPGDVPGTLEHVGELALQAGLDMPPTVVWNPSSPSADALVFGRPGHYRMALGISLLVAPRPMFDAVVRHELAHIRNRDIGMTYLANAIWYSFLVLAALPYAVTRLREGSPVPVMLRIVGLTLLVYITRNAILRSREHYADVRASHWEGASGALTKVVGTLKPKLRGRSALVAVHPDADARLRVIADPIYLMRLSPMDVLGAALAGAIAVPAFATVFAAFASGTSLITLGQTVASVIISPFVGGAVGVGLLRSDFASRVLGSRRQPLWPLTLALAGGLLLGDWLSPTSAIEGRGLLGSSSETLAAALILVAIALTLIWLRSALELWIVARVDGTPARTYLPVVVVSGMIFVWTMGLLYSLLFYAKGFGGVGESIGLGLSGNAAVLGALLLYVSSLKTTMAVAIALGLFPVVVHWVARRSRNTKIPDWAWLDTPQEAEVWRPDRTDLRRTLWLGFVGGFSAMAWIVLLRLAVRLLTSDEARQTPELILGLAAAFTWLSVLASGVVAFLVARRAAAGGVVLGLAGGLLSALLASVAVVLMQPAFGGSMSWNLFATVAPRPVASSLPLAILVSAFASRQRPDRGDPHPTRDNRVLAIAILTLITLLIVPLFAVNVARRAATAPAPSASPELANELTEYVSGVGVPFAQRSQAVLDSALDNLSASTEEASRTDMAHVQILVHDEILAEAESFIPPSSEVADIHDALTAILKKRSAELRDFAESGSRLEASAAFNESTSLLSEWIAGVELVMKAQGLE